MNDFREESMSISSPLPPFTDGIQKIAAAVAGLGLLILIVALFGVQLSNNALWLSIAIGSITLGTLLYSQRAYANKLPGIKNDGVWFSSIANRGVIGWITGIVITGFYVLLYWYPHLLGHSNDGANSGLVSLFDPFSLAIKGKAASQWFVYGSLYTLAILVFGFKFIWKYRHNKYQIWRTISVMFSKPFLLFFCLS